MTLLETQQQHGANFLPGHAVPTGFGDIELEYKTARSGVVLIDRSDEGRVMLTGQDRLAIVHRISTNAVDVLQPGEGRATVFTTPVGRIIDRVVLHNVSENKTLVRTGTGRGDQISSYLQRNIFFRDRMQVKDETMELVQFVLYGPQVGAIASSFAPEAGQLPLHHVLLTEFEDFPLYITAVDPITVPGIGLITLAENAPALWQEVMTRGAGVGIRPAGLAVAELLRVTAGRPGAAQELTGDYIPLEVGLWSDVSFTKGCYTGQEIIARMESRGQLAKTLVGVTLSGPCEAGSEWSVDGRKQGVVTSVVQKPNDSWIGLGVVRPSIAEVGGELMLPNGVVAVITTAHPGYRHR